jgi:SAM-dependent methyltransferase
MTMKKLKTILALPYRIFTTTSGIDIRKIPLNLKGLLAYIQDSIAYNRALDSESPFKIDITRFLVIPTLTDRYDSSGVAQGDYFHQDLWYAKKIFASNPAEHWDIGSRVDGFISHLLVFRSVNVIDIRPLESNTPGLTFCQGDITHLFLEDDSVQSLSCLHTLEHIGLGRYGDPIDPWGWVKGMEELQRVLAPGGRLYFSVPIGKERVEFNAHRIFDPITIIKNFPGLELTDFAAVNAKGDLDEPANWQDYRNVDYSCGLFIFEKRLVLTT